MVTRRVIRAPGGAAGELGATHLGDARTRFLVWAPYAEHLEVIFAAGTPVGMNPAGDGYYELTLDDTPPGTRYRYRLHRGGQDPVDRNDPASRWQPDGLEGPSAVDDPSFGWTDSGWRHRHLHEQVLYEVHVGVFTAAGTFDAVIDHLDELATLGVTTVELMPVWQFPGGRNWGYDGVLPFAVQQSYGGPAGLRRLVDAAHARGLGVVLDVVYNHFGPEGNHLPEFGPYLTERYGTPWGPAVNFDGAGSDGVRRFVVENAVRWVRDFHVDGLRLDAVHAIFDASAVHILEAIATAVHAEADRTGRRVQVIAETDQRDPRLLRPPQLGGYGLDGQWLDDVHHAAHVALSGERRGYYVDFDGLPDLAGALRDRYVMAGRYSRHRGHTVGRSARDVAYQRFIVCTQNHDQVGNRVLGDRQAARHGLEELKLSAATLLLLPFTPMLFMGQEYGELAPFPYFVSHTDPDLVEAVRQGRRREFAFFSGQGEPFDPQDPATFEVARLDRSRRHRGDHAVLYALYAELLRIRRDVAPIAAPEAWDAVPFVHGPATVSFVRELAGDDGAESVLVVLHAAATSATVPLPAPHAWQPVIDTAASAWGGPGGGHLNDDGGRFTVQPRSAVLLRRFGSGRDPSGDRRPSGLDGSSVTGTRVSAPDEEGS